MNRSTVQLDAPRPRAPALAATLALIGLASGGLWLAMDDEAWPEASPSAARTPGAQARAGTAPAQAAAAGPDAPHAAAVAAPEDAPPTPAAGRDSGAGAVPPAAVTPQQLSASRWRNAEAFLREVQLAPQPRGGFVVQAVLADSRYQRMGLRPGDVLHTLDTPRMVAIDDTSMVALMLQTEIELDVYRQGQPLRLRLALNREEADDDDPGPQP